MQRTTKLWVISTTSLNSPLQGNLIRIRITAELAMAWMIRSFEESSNSVTVTQVQTARSIITTMTKTWILLCKEISIMSAKYRSIRTQVWIHPPMIFWRNSTSMIAVLRRTKQLFQTPRRSLNICSLRNEWTNKQRMIIIVQS